MRDFVHALFVRTVGGLKVGSYMRRPIYRCSAAVPKREHEDFVGACVLPSKQDDSSLYLKNT